VRKVVPFIKLLARAFLNLSANDPIRMAAATAFFSFFALPAIVIILTQLYGDWLTGNKQWVSGQLFGILADLFGSTSARQLQDISQHLQQPRSSALLTGLSIVVLLLASTTLFTTIKNSLNQLWNVRAATQRRLLYGLFDKLVALGIIVFTGLLFTGSVVLHEAISNLFDSQLTSPTPRAWAGRIQHHTLSVLVLTTWLGIVFKLLPDVRVPWRAVWVGGFFTALLVLVGEQVLDRLLIHSPVRTLYGSAGGIILVLLFVFYCSLIFYYGASFTRQYAQWKELAAEPNAHSVAYKINEVVTQGPSSQP
jgi:membrane protein